MERKEQHYGYILLIETRKGDMLRLIFYFN